MYLNFKLHFFNRKQVNLTSIGELFPFKFFSREKSIENFLKFIIVNNHIIISNMENVRPIDK